MDLRSNQDDRPYRVARNTEYGMQQQQRSQWEEQQEEVMSMQGYNSAGFRWWLSPVALSCLAV
jgi:hypothetical protein